MFFGEVTSSIPDISKEKEACEEEWNITKALLESRLTALTEFETSEKEQKIEFDASKAEVDEEIKTAYPCQNNFECTVVGETFAGTRYREICNSIEEEELDSGDEDCRYELVVDPKADPPAEGEQPKALNLAIIMTRGDKFFCSMPDELNPPEWEQPKEQEPPKEAVKEAGKEGPASIPYFNMIEKRKTYRTELRTAEKEIPSFDVTRHERCLSCGALGIDRFVCKSKLKIYTGDVTKREKNGLAYLKTLDEKGEFVENSNVKCEAANFMQTVQDDNL